MCETSDTTKLPFVGLALVLDDGGVSLDHCRPKLPAAPRPLPCVWTRHSAAVCNSTHVNFVSRADVEISETEPQGDCVRRLDREERDLGAVRVPEPLGASRVRHTGGAVDADLQRTRRFRCGQINRTEVVSDRWEVHLDLVALARQNRTCAALVLLPTVHKGRQTRNGSRLRERVVEER